MLYLLSQLVHLLGVIVGVARGIDKARGVVRPATPAAKYRLLPFDFSATFELTVTFRADLIVLEVVFAPHAVLEAQRVVVREDALELERAQVQRFVGAGRLPLVLSVHCGKISG